MNTTAGHQKTLYLIPTLLGDTPSGMVLPPHVTEVIMRLKHFITEDIKSARRFLIRAGYDPSFGKTVFHVLNEHTSPLDIPAILNATGHETGLMSEAGVPAVADPGADLIREAHVRNIKVVPLVGPSSVLLALMASGLNGQRFAFNGYLPVKDDERRKRIRELEHRSSLEKESQLFIEAPYRNNQLTRALLQCCRKSTLLCIAANLTTSMEWIKTRTIGEWSRGHLPDLNRQPAVFIIQSF